MIQNYVMQNKANNTSFAPLEVGCYVANSHFREDLSSAKARNTPQWHPAVVGYLLTAPKAAWNTTYNTCFTFYILLD